MHASNRYGARARKAHSGLRESPLSTPAILSRVPRRAATLARLSVLTAATLVAACDSGSKSGASAQPGSTATSGQAAQSAAARRVRLKRVGTFRSPVYLTAPRGDRRRLFVVEQRGRIRVVVNGHKLARPFLDIRRSVLAGGERGLLSMAFPRDYARSRRFYVYFTGRNGDIHIQEFRRSAANANRALARTRRNVLTIAHHAFPNHNGGQLQFGPDGLLYAGVGDGGSEGDPNRYGQNLGVLYGKLLRIDPRASGGRPYTVPDSNPFVGRSGVRPEIYAYGLRNPWRFSFDRSTGAITIGDVGQGAIEEIDHEPRDGAAGVNFGWSAFEGRSRYNGGSAPDAVPPVIQHTHADGWCSIVGGYVMRDASVPALLGRYVYGDLCQPRLYAARLRSHSASDRRLGLTVPELVSFGEDAASNVYAVSLSGPVYRIDAG
jgi:glucose/arabinose dehydrogenase